MQSSTTPNRMNVTLGEGGVGAPGVGVVEGPEPNVVTIMVEVEVTVGATGVRVPIIRGVCGCDCSWEAFIVRERALTPSTPVEIMRNHFTRNERIWRHCRFACRSQNSFTLIPVSKR